jgi:brefeldin A-inhibited guanine nucleotide-exchange protein
LIYYVHVYVKVSEIFGEGQTQILISLIPLENDTLARIGTACFQQLLEDNVKKLSPEKWELIVGTFIQLFSTTTARQLFDESLRAENTLPEDAGENAAQGELASDAA